VRSWGEEVMAAALIDRLLHQRQVLSIEGNSYRMRHHAELWHLRLRDCLRLVSPEQGRT